MGDWFAKLMDGRLPRSTRALPGPAVSPHLRAGAEGAARDARYDAILRTLREREAVEREAREKRLRGYRQSLPESSAASDDASTGRPRRLERVRAKVPCSVTPDARALLDRIAERFPGRAVTLPIASDGRQVVMLAAADGEEPLRIGRVEECAPCDPRAYDARRRGLTVETDDGATLVLRLHYPRTPVRITSRREKEAKSVELTELRPALDPRSSDRGPSPRLVWLTRAEIETMDALRSRDYEAFYVRLKLEVQAGIWSALSALLATEPASRWHEGTCYTVRREPDSSSRRIHQRTVDDRDRVVDIGADRIYDAASGTDILLLYLDGDLLADFADIYFTLVSLGTADAYLLKEELFTVIRRFWAGSQSLASCYGSNVGAVVRMCQRTLPMPAQAPLLRQDWSNLRQSLVDRYGEGGRKAARFAGEHVRRPRIGPSGWPFESFPAGEVNVGLRLVHRQERRDRGEPVARIVELQSVIMIAERLPSPAEIDLAWVRRHDWILAKALLDRSYRDALLTIGQEAATPRRARELDAKRDRLYAHLRANILHYQRAIWRREDPQQRALRYHKSGKTVPLEWRFELESGGAAAIEEVRDRLLAAEVDGQFAAYSDGREMELEQVIDPAGPITYHGNCAVYHMRPQLDDADAFSMLHYFKSEYLRASEETGELEIDAGPVDLARSGLESDANEAADAEAGHELVVASGFARGALSANGHRPAASACVILRADGERGARTFVGGAACDDGATRIEFRAPRLTAGAGAPDAAAKSILGAHDGVPLPSVRVGGARDPATARPSVAFDRSTAEWSPIARARAGSGPAGRILPAHPTPLKVASLGAPRAARPDDPVIVARTEGERVPRLRAGAHDPARGPHAIVILGRDDRRLRLGSISGAATMRTNERKILARRDEWLRPSLFAR